jgi:TIR domain
VGRTVFVSYCHAQGDWVWDRLVPSLRAGGAEVHIDRERFNAGRAVIGQMDATQEMAEMSLLVLSPEYLASRYCLHEMDKAIAQDPQFRLGLVLPVMRIACNLPDSIRTPNPLCVNLCDDKNSGEWRLILRSCGADLGTDAPDWLAARDDIHRFLQRNESVNLVVTGNPKWRELIQHLATEMIKDLGRVDLSSGATVPRRGLVVEILKACGALGSVPPEPEDLPVLHRALSERRLSRIAIEHFDLVSARHHYGVDLFAALRYLLMESRKLVILVQSRAPFASLLPQDHPLSSVDLKTVELNGRR